jgi:hypothetical protein
LKGNNTDLRDLVEPAQVGQLTRYLRRLIVEEPYIRARLENQGASVVLMPSSNPDQVSYASMIGNDTHLDLITAEQVLEQEFSQGERDTIKEWAAGFTSAQAAEYNNVKGGAIRKRRERVLDKLENKLAQDGGLELARGTGNGHAQTGVEEIGVEPEEGRDTGRAQIETSPQEGDLVGRTTGEEGET